MTPVTSLPRFKAPRSMSFTPAKWAQSLVRLVPAVSVLMTFAFLARGRFRSFEGLEWADAAVFGPNDHSEEAAATYWTGVSGTMDEMKQTVGLIDRLKASLSLTSLRPGRTRS